MGVWMVYLGGLAGYFCPNITATCWNKINCDDSGAMANKKCSSTTGVKCQDDSAANVVCRECTNGSAVTPAVTSMTTSSPCLQIP
jgi:hypothetical protein